MRVKGSEMLERLAKAWGRKWDGRWRFEARDGALYHDQGPANVLARVAHEGARVRKGGFSHTRHRS